MLRRRKILLIGLVIVCAIFLARLIISEEYIGLYVEGTVGGFLPLSRSCNYYLQIPTTINPTDYKYARPMMGFALEWENDAELNLDIYKMVKNKYELIPRATWIQPASDVKELGQVPVEPGEKYRLQVKAIYYFNHETCFRKIPKCAIERDNTRELKI